MDNRERFILGGIVLLALGIRLIHVAGTSHLPTVQHLIGDAAAYYEWGQRIAGGDWIGKEGFYQAPLYPYVIGGLMKLGGEGVWKIRALQCVLGAGGVFALWYATRELFGREAGLVAAGMLALYGPAIFYDGIVQKASLGLFLVCALLAAVVWALRGEPWRWLFVGIVLGLLILVRENAIVWLIVLFTVAASGGSAVSTRRGRELPITNYQLPGRRARFAEAAGRTIAFLFGLAIVLGPVAIRNRAVAGEWSISTFQAGPNFYIGNHRGADGRYVPLVPGHESPEFERSDATELAQKALARALSPREVSGYWFAQTWREVRTDFAGWLRLLAYKLAMTVNRFEVPDVESEAVFAASSPALRVLSHIWHFGVLLPLAVIGVIVTWRDRRRLWVLHALFATMVVAIAAFYVLGRYRLPLVPILIVFAAAGCVATLRHLRARSTRPVVSLFIVGIVAGIGANIPIQDEARLNAFGFMNAGVARAKDGDVAGAEKHFRDGLARFPESPECHVNLAMALSLRGAYSEAIPHYQAALAAKPGLSGVRFNFAVALEHAGRLEEAISEYRKALKEDPSDNDARSALQRLGR